MKILKEIKNSPFKMPIKKYYFGKLKYGTPYFFPINFEKSILSVRKLKLMPEKEREEKIKKYPWNKDNYKFSNIPMSRRTKDWIVKIFDNYYFISLGYPIKIHINDLGWKDKWNSPRFEWNPSFKICFFHWQFCIYYNSPDGNNDKYYEMFLWWRYYCDKDIQKAEETWGWVDAHTKESTWNKNYLK